MSKKEKRILFSWSGGGLPGLDIHTGIWKALSSFDIYPTTNVGTSAGAIMAALNSSGQGIVIIEKIMRDLKDKDVRSKRFMWRSRIAFINSFLKHDKIEKLLRQLLPPTFNRLVKPLEVYFTVEQTGQSTFSSSGDLIEPILASMSIAGVFPPVVIDNGIHLVDGGTSANLPLPQDWKTYDEIYLLVAARPLYYRKSRGIITRLMYNIDLLLEDQIRDTIARVRRHKPGRYVHVLRPQVRATRGSLHFDHDLINEAYIQTQQQLQRESNK